MRVENARRFGLGLGLGIAAFVALAIAWDWREHVPLPAKAVALPGTALKRECPPVYDGRLLARQVYRAPDREESVLACYYAAPGKGT